MMASGGGGSGQHPQGEPSVSRRRLRASGSPPAPHVPCARHQEVGVYENRDPECRGVGLRVYGLGFRV